MCLKDYLQVCSLIISAIYTNGSDPMVLTVELLMSTSDQVEQKSEELSEEKRKPEEEGKVEVMLGSSI